MSDCRQGKVYLVGGGPGDPGLFTLKGVNVLKKSDVVIYDALVNVALLDYAPPGAERIFVGKTHDPNRYAQHDIESLMIEKAQSGKIVVRLKGGDPFIFGRGGEEALALAQAGILWEVVPGVSSGYAVPAVFGIPLTHRAISSNVTFVTGHECAGKHRDIAWHHLAKGSDTLVIFMGIQNLERIVSKLIDAGRSPQTPVAILSKGTCWDHEERMGTLESILSAAGSIATPALIIVGDVVRLRERIKHP